MDQEDQEGPGALNGDHSRADSLGQKFEKLLRESRGLWVLSKAGRGRMLPGPVTHHLAALRVPTEVPAAAKPSSSGLVTCRVVGDCGRRGWLLRAGQGRGAEGGGAGTPQLEDSVSSGGAQFGRKEGDFLKKEKKGKKKNPRII